MVGAFYCPLLAIYGDFCYNNTNTLVTAWERSFWITFLF
ncbi:hypothetical protein HMPREF1250_0120 [Megasphaera vaginalis (ex Srinivasan et al. 2021)]|uniref:Uncharacterized protein n=1 Tax=Megasphaera vaginalis (ex Srinivasan et al. 2021) TaxID=1111454 RepID=U7UV24_9FIRM|nr:hypothetical protein HMPREF1250_0120 [Megasphaera vaginalis (ex Srinivasan et al. 2021)]